MDTIEAVKQLVKTAQDEAVRFPDKVEGSRIAERKAVRLLQYEYSRVLEQIMSKGDAYDESRRFTTVDELLTKFPDGHQATELTPIMTVEEADDPVLDKVWLEVAENDARAELYPPGKKPKPKYVKKKKKVEKYKLKF